MPKKRPDLTGRKFGMLTVLNETGVRNSWNCKCDCGNSKKLYGPSLLSGNTQSCGCLRKLAGRKRSGASLRFPNDYTDKEIYLANKNAFRGLQSWLVTHGVAFEPMPNGTVKFTYKGISRPCRSIGHALFSAAIAVGGKLEASKTSNLK